MKAKPVEVIEATVRAMAGELKTAGLKPFDIRVAVFEAVEPALPHLADARRRDLELRINQALDEILGEPE